MECAAIAGARHFAVAHHEFAVLVDASRSEEKYRDAVNKEWVKMFPDPASRPARQIMEVPMEPQVLVECDFMAVIEEGRQP